MSDDDITAEDVVSVLTSVLADIASGHTSRAATKINAMIEALSDEPSPQSPTDGPITWGE